MNAKTLLASALILAVTTPAFAQQADQGSKSSHKTRAQVVAELQQAQADGSAATYGFLGSSVSYDSAANIDRSQSETVIASAPKSLTVSNK